jgi:hypothetical protein
VPIACLAIACFSLALSSSETRLAVFTQRGFAGWKLRQLKVKLRLYIHHETHGGYGEEDVVFVSLNNNKQSAVELPKNPAALCIGSMVQMATCFMLASHSMA